MTEKTFRDLVIPRKEKKDYQLVPPGQWQGRIISIIQLGVQPSTYKGVVRYVNQIAVIFEFPEHLVLSGETQGMPLIMTNTFTQSVEPTAGLRKHLLNKLRPNLDDKDYTKFSLTSLLNEPVILNVVHKQNKKDKDKMSAFIVDVSIPRKTEVIPEAKHKLVDYRLEDGENEDFQNFYPWLKDKITAGKNTKIPDKNQASNEDEEAAF